MVLKCIDFSLRANVTERQIHCFLFYNAKDIGVFVLVAIFLF